MVEERSEIQNQPSQPGQRRQRRTASASVRGDADGPLTRAGVAAMDEETLRSRVLIPLLKAQGWEDVREGHGAAELGKDIVGWRLDENGERVDLAVVAKATAIDGQAKITNRSAGGVANQVLQCFGASYTERTNGELRPIARCQVITNKEATQTGTEAFWAIVRSTNHAEKVQLIDGERLWDLVPDNLPQAFLGQALELAAQTDRLDTHYRADVAVDEAEITITFKEKFPGAARERPIRVEIADAPERAEIVAALRRVYETSEPVQLSESASRNVRIADEFRHLAGPFASFGGSRIVTIGPARSEKVAEARLILDDGMRDPLLIGPLALDLIPRADGEVRLANLRRRHPALVRLDVRAGMDRPDVDFTYEPASRNVEDLRTFARIADHLRRPCGLRLVDLDSRESILEGASRSTTAAPPDPAWLDLLDDLVTLQERAGVALSVSAAPTDEDLATLDRLRAIVRTGALRGTWKSLEITATITDRAALEVMLQGEARSLRLEADGIEHLADTTIALGRAAFVYASARLADPAAARNQLAAGSEDVTLRFIPGDSDVLERLYPNWGTRRRPARRGDRRRGK